jgi:phosphate acetyltransferase
MTSLIENIRQQSQSEIKKIILTETEDPRIQQAAKICVEQKIADILFVDNGYIQKNPDLYQQFSQQLFELRQSKGLTIDTAKELLLKPTYFGTMMVKNHLADGLVAGANTTTLETFLPALQVIKAESKYNLASSFMLMQSPLTNFGYNGTFIFADCGLNINPNPDELAQIAIQSAESFRTLVGAEPKIAMLSFSTGDSGKGEAVDKIKSTVQKIEQLNPNLIVDGPIQADAAIVPNVAKLKNSQGAIKGDANILIFPDLNSGNIAYKLIERLANTQAIGPISQGLNQPINDLSRGCSVEDIVTAVAITSIQSRSVKL